ncbi:signal peptide peptidase SppA [Geomesophilobacter sediminis]|uniref:Signal peptide peptidase SppA n=1 Tax=Geomesophilobacter sediminis TaxID=2798584 RepID=A0A8J7JK04_9BACT|nr:signal peptide peptidase SppA [Geomesophilobacter sediminis]MBJ6723440.1 signal peptide peptidase SppA [Geomesophilobacter sediminis]
MNWKWLLVLVAFFLNGCIHVSVIPPVAPFQEKVLEGEGTPKILLLDVSGTISEKKRGTSFRERPSMVGEIKEALKKAEDDPDVVAVLVRINSPGGTVTGSDIIYHELMAFKKRKKVPVHAAIVGLGTSGGYYVASAADRITAHKTAITGSIGVIFLHFEVDGLMNKLGVVEWSAKSGDKKDMMTPFRAATPEEKQIAMGVIDGLYGRFLEVVLARPGNTLDRKALTTLADGRVYTADQALAAHLIDGVCYLDEALDDLKMAAKVKQARVVSYYRAGNYQGSIYADAEASAQMVGPFSLGPDVMELLPDLGFAYLWKP